MPQALDAMLKKYTILKMEGDGGNAAVLFFVVRERRKQPGAGAGAAAVSAGGEGKGAQSGAGLGEALRGDSGVAAATDAEEAAVTLSCKVRVCGATCTRGRRNIGSPASKESWPSKFVHVSLSL